MHSWAPRVCDYTFDIKSTENIILYAHKHWVACLPIMNACQSSDFYKCFFPKQCDRPWNKKLSGEYTVLMCGMFTSELRHFTDDFLGVNIIGTTQINVEGNTPMICMNTIAALNIRTYITFNEQGKYIDKTRIEKDLLLQSCRDCRFISIPIVDYTAPTKDSLLRTWGELDFFHSHASCESNILTRVPQPCIFVIHKRVPFVGKFSNSEMHSWAPRASCIAQQETEGQESC